MNTQKIAAGIAAAAVVAGAIFALQSFDAEKVACEDIAGARAELQALYDAGVNASVQVYGEEKAAIDERLHQCLSAKPTDPCADAQSARDAAVAAFNGIASPPDNAPYAEFQKYFKQRDDAYNAYRQAKNALDVCRAANPPRGPVPYEQSDTKACFDVYDTAVEAARNRFSKDTQAMRMALQAALAALDAREKACNPPTGAGKFTEIPGGGNAGGGGGTGAGGSANDISSCRMLDANFDAELFSLRARAGAIPGEIQAIQTSIDNIKKRMSPLQVALSEVDTYIPPEATKTQFEGALNGIRAERKMALESSLTFYRDMLARREVEKAALEKELQDVNARIRARLAEIEKENAQRRRRFPTTIHLAKPESGGCSYYHCHGMLCGRPDPASENCGHGATTQDDTDCKKFFDSYLKAAGAN